MLAPRSMTVAPVRTISLMPYDAEQRDERVDLRLRPVRLDDHGLGRDVDDGALVQLDDLDHLGPVGVGGADLDQGELVLDQLVLR